MHGYAVDEVMAMPSIIGLCHESEQERMRGYARDRTAGRWVPPRYRYRAVKRCGTSIWVEQFVRVIDWHGEAALLSSIFDVDAEENHVNKLTQLKQSMEAEVRERTEALDTSNRQLHLYESIINQMSDRISVIGTDYRFRLSNRSNLEFRQRSLDDLIGVHLRETVGDAWFEQGAKPMLDQCFAGETVEGVERQIQDRHGEERHLALRSEPFRDADGTIGGAIVSLRDVTEAKRTEEKLRLFASVIDQVSDRISVVDTSYRYRLTNKANLEYHKMSVEDFLGVHIADIFGEIGFLEQAKPELDRCFAGETVKSLRHGADAEGKNRMLDILLEPYRETDGRISGAVITLRDVTEAHRLSERLAYQASHDELTGLINRRAFEQDLNIAIEETANNSRSAVFCFIDLDQFKIINDTVGHLVGDRLLEQVAKLLEARVREGDVLARLGGDEFGLLLHGCSLRRARRAAEKLIAVLNDYRFCHEGHVFEVGASIGITVINRSTKDSSELMSQADLACYAAKDEGRNRVQVYEKRDASLSRRREEMQQAGGMIRAALEQDQFTLFGQPIEAVLDRESEIQRLEILLRMRSKNDELVLPGSFIPAAERYGFMREIDRWVIKRTIDYLANRRADSRLLQLNINLSGITLSDDNLLSFICDVLQETGTPPHRLCFEITETAAIRNLIKTEQVISELRQLGCQFALDDFGSGLSSLNYLKRLPVDYLKIDRSFIHDVHRDSSSRALVAAIHQMAKALDIETVAEGVEDSSTLEVLKDLGINLIQGFEVGTPKPLSDYDQHQGPA